MADGWLADVLNLLLSRLHRCDRFLLSYAALLQGLDGVIERFRRCLLGGLHGPGVGRSVQRSAPPRAVALRGAVGAGGRGALAAVSRFQAAVGV